MSINPITRNKIKDYLNGFIDQQLAVYSQRNLREFHDVDSYLAAISSDGDLKPFHASIIPSAIMRLNRFERSLSTGLGSTFEECARLIALDHHAVAIRSYDIHTSLDQAVWASIDLLISNIDRNNQRQIPSITEMLEKLQSIALTGIAENHVVRADLYVQRHDGSELFFEIKSPKPNKGQCLEVMQRLLRIYAIKQNSTLPTHAFYAMAYNPWGANRASYTYSIVKKYTDFTNAVVIGQEFWSLIGESSTYTELLEIYREVGLSKSSEITKKLL
uniref:type II site-specific deoxyribonuclease n=1 Tax=Herpetosiphon aurantiacus TaxID=65 RepID=Q4PIZ8_HERAU|nr:ENase [Herpetosiphon giganteus]